MKNSQDDELFAEAMGKVRPMIPANKVIAEKVKPKPHLIVCSTPPQPLPHSNANSASPAQAEEPWVLKADGVSRERLKRFAAGRPPVEQSLDLHGVTRSQALELLEDLFRAALHQRLRALCIIHGRGLHSEGKAVLKEAVYQWLHRGPFASSVLAVIPQPGSGGGACLVLLRRK